jgi:hypothetical protein
VWSWQKWAARPCGRLAREVRYKLSKALSYTYTLYIVRGLPSYPISSLYIYKDISLALSFTILSSYLSRDRRPY